MLKLKRILFPTDFSRCANQALDHALHVAQRYGAGLHIFHAQVLHIDEPQMSSFSGMTSENLHNWQDEVVQSKMKELLSKMNAGNVPITTASKRGISSAPTILEYAETNDIDLIIMGTHGRRGIGHLFLGSVAEELVRHAPCPVMTIREQKEPVPVHEFKSILAPVDFSEYATRTLTYAKHLAQTYGAQLQLLHVVEQAIHPSFYAGGVDSLFAIAPDIREKCLAQLDRLAKETPGPQVPVELHVIEGHAARDIVNFAKDQKSDMMVIATHGLTGIEHLLLGSITEKVVRMAPCPVFTVKSFGKALIEIPV